MPLVEDPTGALVKRLLDYHNKRHDVIASNIANSNTPGYRAFDLVLQKEIDGSQQLEPKRTSPQHMTLDPSLNRIGAKIEPTHGPERPDGNNVSMDQEFLKMMENRVRYEAGMELYDRWGSLFRIAREAE
jgi:flagellar basal-body rod protein FlgB